MDLTIYPEEIPEDEYGVDIAQIDFDIETIVNSYNEEIQFADYSKIREEGQNLNPLIREPESQETQQLMMQIYGKLMQEVGSNPLIQRIAEEMGVY
jgi:Zn-finger domain-containing protein